MAIRQYIGARYMPKFMGTYDATTAYEALSVVDNGMGTSYVSNKPVPAGTPLTDPDYWAVYGASSGAIIHLQDQVDDLYVKVSNRFNANSNVVLIGDSWTSGGFGAALENCLPHANFYTRAEGSAGFKDPGSLNHTFADLVGLVTVPDDDAITDLIFAGGVNDRSYTYAEMVAAIQTCIDAAITRFPYAYIHVVFNNRPTTQFALSHYIKAGMTFNGYQGKTIVYDCHKSVSFDKWVDSLHVNADGYIQCAKYCACALMGGKPTIGEASKTVNASCAELNWTGTATLIETDDSFSFRLSTVNVTGLNITASTINTLHFVFSDTVIIPNDSKRHAAASFIKFADTSAKKATVIELYSNSATELDFEVYTLSNIEQFYFSGERFNITRY